MTKVFVVMYLVKYLPFINQIQSKARFCYKSEIEAQFLEASEVVYRQQFWDNKTTAPKLESQQIKTQINETRKNQ